MDRATFQDAVEAARDFLQKYTEFVGDTPAEALVRLYEYRPAELREDLLRDLIYSSTEIMAAWDGLNLIAEKLLLQGERLPPDLAGWVADRLALEPRRPRPTTRGQNPDANVPRNLAVMAAVRHLIKVNHWMKPTRRRKLVGNEACFEGGSACDAVGIAAGLSYKNVEAIWTDSASPESPIYRNSPRPSYANQRNK